MTDTTVKYFSSTMVGAPALSGASAGTLVSVLDACLVNGFGSVTVNSLVITSNVATATVSAGHNFTMVGATGPVIKIEGATPSALNNEWRISSVTNSTTFTFATTGISDQTATGTITAKRAPAGYAKSYSGTNSAAYVANSVLSTQFLFRIDDTNANFSRIRGYESIANQSDFDLDNGTGPFPTNAQLSGGAYIVKGTNSNRSWNLFADQSGVYIAIDDATNSWQSVAFFGDFVSYKSPDAYNCMIAAHTTNSIITSLLQVVATNGGWTARGYNQLGGSIIQNRYSHRITSNNLGASGQAYPSITDNMFHGWPVEVWDGAINARGMMPGLWNPIHNQNITQGTLIENIPQLPNRTLFVQSVRTGQIAIDISGPWR